MDRIARVLVVRALALALLSCGGSSEPAQLAPGSASCAELADHELAQCPELEPDPSFNRARCEVDRVQHETTGCGEPYARFVLCAAVASGYDCEEGPLECLDELDHVIACRSLFTQRTGCARIERDELCAGLAEPHAYSCVGPGPEGCVLSSLGQSEAQQALGVAIRCCPSFAGEGPSYFVDP